MAQAAAAPSLHADNPYVLRVDQGAKVPEVDVHAALKSGDMGFVHSFTTGSTVDGPGVRVVAWTAGCQFRCLYCHNPDTWTLRNGIPVTIEQAVDGLRKYAHGLKVMKGGFTLSGGEPLMQARFAVKLFAAAKEMGLHTAIETNGFYGDKLTDDELRLIDLVILDMKAFSPANHKKVTGLEDNTPVLDFGRRLAALKRPCRVLLHTDSQYVQKGITEWLPGWKARGWRHSIWSPSVTPTSPTPTAVARRVPPNAGAATAMPCSGTDSPPRRYYRAV